MTWLISSSSAMSVACIGPAPPNAINAKSRGSKPRAIEISLIALTIRATAIRMMPSAARATFNPSKARAMRSTAVRAKPSSNSTTPPSFTLDASRPITRFASVTVGSNPPLP